MQHLRQHWLPALITTVGVVVASVAGLVLYDLLDDFISATELTGPTTVEIELPAGELTVFHSTTAFGNSTPTPPASVVTLVDADGVSLPVRPDFIEDTRTFQNPFEFYAHFATAEVPEDGTYRLTIDRPGDYAVTPDSLTELQLMLPSAIVATIGSVMAVVGAIWWAVAYSRSRKRRAAEEAAARSLAPIAAPQPAPSPTTPPPPPARADEGGPPHSIPESSSDTPW